MPIFEELDLPALSRHGDRYHQSTVADYQQLVNGMALIKLAAQICCPG